MWVASLTSFAYLNIIRKPAHGQCRDDEHGNDDGLDVVGRTPAHLTCPSKTKNNNKKQKTINQPVAGWLTRWVHEHVVRRRPPCGVRRAFFLPLTRWVHDHVVRRRPPCGVRCAFFLPLALKHANDPIFLPTPTQIR